jgi:hypothetical protein
MGELTCHVGELTHSASELTWHMGELTCHVGELTHSASELT